MALYETDVQQLASLTTSGVSENTGSFSTVHSRIIAGAGGEEDRKGLYKALQQCETEKSQDSFTFSLS